MNLPELRAALAARLELVQPTAGQRRPQVFDKLRSQVTPPTLMVAYPETINYHHASMAESSWEMTVFGIGAAGAYDEAAQDMVDAWLSDDGPSSVRAALEGDPTLGGISEDVTVTASEGYSIYAIDGIAYLGTEWKVLVLG